MNGITKNELLLQAKRDWNREKTLGIDIVEVQKLNSDKLKFGINFGASGTITTEQCVEFLNKLNECIKLVKHINSKSEDGK